MHTDGYTLREIDIRLGRPKGSAFRAFKTPPGGAPGETWTSPCCRRTPRGRRIERLRAAGRIYRSSINVIILTESGFERVRAELERD